MNPKLKIDLSDLFEAFPAKTALQAQPVADPNFVAPGQQLPGDFIDADSNDAQEFAQIQQLQRVDQGRQYDTDIAIGQSHAGDPNPAQDPAPLAVLYPQVATNATDGMQAAASKQAQGFANEQVREHITAGVLTTLHHDTLVGSNVIYKSASTAITGTVIAVGDAEFAVVWEDKTASVERKNDYELVIKA